MIKGFRYYYVLIFFVMFLSFFSLTENLFISIFFSVGVYFFVGPVLVIFYYHLSRSKCVASDDMDLSVSGAYICSVRVCSFCWA